MRTKTIRPGDIIDALSLQGIPVRGELTSKTADGRRGVWQVTTDADGVFSCKYSTAVLVRCAPRTRAAALTKPQREQLSDGGVARASARTVQALQLRGLITDVVTGVPVVIAKITAAGRAALEEIQTLERAPAPEKARTTCGADAPVAASAATRTDAAPGPAAIQCVHVEANMGRSYRVYLDGQTEVRVEQLVKGRGGAKTWRVLWIGGRCQLQSSAVAIAVQAAFRRRDGDVSRLRVPHVVLRDGLHYSTHRDRAHAQQHMDEMIAIGDGCWYSVVPASEVLR